MPELPEVETIVRYLSTSLLAKVPERIDFSDKKLRKPIDILAIESLLGEKILDVRRRAKYLLLIFSNNKVLVVHLGMSGALLFRENFEELQKHDHMHIEFEGGGFLVYNDPRRFGLIEMLYEQDLIGYFSKYGVEPFSEDFNEDYMQERLSRLKTNIKTALMDQSIVVGVGNIYACESLWLSKINPKSYCYMLTRKDICCLIQSVRDVLSFAISAGGSSLKDYRNADGRKGGFQDEFSVYGREGMPCKLCAREIVMERIGGRSTFFCLGCQQG